MSSQKPTHEQRRATIEEFTRREVDHERSLGRKPDERKIRKNWENIAERTDRERRW